MVEKETSYCSLFCLLKKLLRRFKKVTTIFTGCVWVVTKRTEEIVWVLENTCHILTVISNKIVDNFTSRTWIDTVPHFYDHILKVLSLTSDPHIVGAFCVARLFEVKNMIQNREGNGCVFKCFVYSFGVGSIWSFLISQETAKPQTPLK